MYIKDGDREDGWPRRRIQFWIMLMRTKVEKGQMQLPPPLHLPAIV